MSTSWILGPSTEGQGWPAIAALSPEVFERYDDMRRELRRLLPPRTIGLCRARMATLLGIDAGPGGPGGGPDDLSRWPDSPHFDDAERAALAVAEQFTVDVTGIDGAQVDALLRYFSPEQTLGLMSALWFEEALLRLGAVLGVAVPDLPAGDR